jgi:hypothetical protein
MNAVADLCIAIAILKRHPHLTATEALEAVTTRGLPLKNSELRRCFSIYIDAQKYQRPDGTVARSREIADRFGKTSATILTWMKADAPEVYARYYRGSGRRSRSNAIA